LGKVILLVSIAVFSGAVEKFFRAKMAQPPRKNWLVRLCRLWRHRDGQCHVTLSQWQRQRDAVLDS